MPTIREYSSNFDISMDVDIDDFLYECSSREITEVIGNFEPRAQVSRVIAHGAPDENGYNIYLEFFIINNPAPVTINFFLERIR